MASVVAVKRPAADSQDADSNAKKPRYSLHEFLGSLGNSFK